MKLNTVFQTTSVRLPHGVNRGLQALIMAGGVMLLLAGCNAILGSEESTVELNLGVDGPRAVLAGIVVEASVEAGGRVRQINALAGELMEERARIRIPDNGPVSVEFSLVAGVNTVATLRASSSATGRDHGFTIHIETGDPRDAGYVGCVPNVYAAPILSRETGLSADSVYLAWWLGIPDGAIC